MTEWGGRNLTEAPTPDGTAHDESIHLLEYWRVLMCRRHIVAVCLGLVLVGTAIFSLIARPEYRATSTLQIERQGPDILTHKDVVNVDPSYAGYQDFYQTQYKILQSRAVLRIAAERLDLLNRPEFAGRKPPPIDRFRSWVATRLGRGGDADTAEDPLDPALKFLDEGLAVRPVRSSHLVKVSFVDRDPVLCRDVANAVSAAYQEFSLTARYTTTAQASEFLTKQVAELQAEIADKERQLQDYSARKELLALRDDTQDISSQALADLNAQYVRAKARLAVADARRRAVAEASTEALPEVLQSPLISSLKQQYAEIERRHSQMAERFHEDWPARRQLAEELQSAHARLELEIESIARQVRGVADADHGMARAEVEGLRQRVEEQKVEVQRVNVDAIEVASLQAEIGTKRQFLDDLVSRQSQTAVSDRLRDTRTSNIRVVDAATVPKSPVRPRKLVNLVIGAVLGLGLGIGAAFLADHLDNTVKTEQDVIRLGGLAVLGHVPVFDAPPDLTGEAAATQVQDPVSWCSHLDPQSVFAEAFKNLRTSILLASPDRPPRQILVTSCEPGDGKSTVAANLAIVLTQLGRRVLLIDADLRRPRIHRALGLQNGKGLSSLLTGNADLEDVLQSSAVPQLDLITSGPVPPTPSELLGSAGLQSLLDRLGAPGGYDHVILDSPPMLQVADSVILAARTDATIIVVRAGKTSRESLIQGAARLRQARAQVAGAVLNAVSERAGYYYYRYDRQAGEVADASFVRRRRRARRRAGSA